MVSLSLVVLVGLFASSYAKGKWPFDLECGDVDKISFQDNMTCTGCKQKCDDFCGSNSTNNVHYEAADCSDGTSGSCRGNVSAFCCSCDGDKLCATLDPDQRLGFPRDRSHRGYYCLPGLGRCMACNGRLGLDLSNGLTAAATAAVALALILCCCCVLLVICGFVACCTAAGRRRVPQRAQAYLIQQPYFVPRQQFVSSSEHQVLAKAPQPVSQSTPLQKPYQQIYPAVVPVTGYSTV
jgi:hypothetical protein